MYLELKTKKYGIIKYQISKEDLEIVKDLVLYVSYVKNTNSMYLMTKDRKYLHRIIMKAKRGEIIDHKNHDTLDNRRENLRIVTKSENNRNSYRAYTDTQKLSEKDIKDILTSKKTNNKLAQKYNVSNCLISKIRTGEMYKDYCSEIKRKENRGRGEKISLSEKIRIKKEVMNCKTSIYALAKKLNMTTARLYNIKNGKIWKKI